MDLVGVSLRTCRDSGGFCRGLCRKCLGSRQAFGFSPSTHSRYDKTRSYNVLFWGQGMGCFRAASTMLYCP